MKLGSLNSWKEIATYLDRGIRTVQRWERELGLPVHRLGRGSRSPVHAFPSELQAWLLRVGADHPNATGAHPHLPPHPDGAVAISRVLVRRSSTLVKQMVDSLWIQRQRADQLVQTLDLVRRNVQKGKSRGLAPTDGAARDGASPAGTGRGPGRLKGPARSRSRARAAANADETDAGLG